MQDKIFEREYLPHAKVVYESCPVQKECLEAAIEKKEYAHGGVWGGLSSKEIDKLVKNRVAARQRQSRNKY